MDFKPLILTIVILVSSVTSSFCNVAYSKDENPQQENAKTVSKKRIPKYQYSYPERKDHTVSETMEYIGWSIT